MYKIKIVFWIFCKNINQISWKYIKVTGDFWFYQNLTIIFDIFRHFHSAPYSSVSSQEKTLWDHETLHNRKICGADFRVSTLSSSKSISSVSTTGLRGWEDGVKHDDVSSNMSETTVYKKFSPLLGSCQADRNWPLWTHFVHLREPVWSNPCYHRSQHHPDQRFFLGRPSTNHHSGFIISFSTFIKQNLIKNWTFIPCLNVHKNITGHRIRPDVVVSHRNMMWSKIFLLWT